MRVTFLGTNGWYDTETGNTVCILVQTKEYDIIFDAGNGFYKIDQHVTSSKNGTGYLFLSHFHLDHVEGLHTLNKLKCFSRLVIGGPEGAKNALNTLLNAPFTVPISKLHYPVVLIELPDEHQSLPFKLETAPLLHADLTLGYRLEADGKVITYCPDTGYCENAVKLARSADLLITECAYRTGETNPDWPHLNPETASSIAKEAGVKELVLVHFDASRYTSQENRMEAEQAARKIFPRSRAAFDEMRIEI